MLVRLGIGKNAGKIIDMLATDALNMERSGTAHVLTPAEINEHAVAMARIEEVEAESLVGRSPTPMAAIHQRTASRRRFL